MSEDIILDNNNGLSPTFRTQDIPVFQLTLAIKNLHITDDVTNLQSLLKDDKKPNNKRKRPSDYHASMVKKARTTENVRGTGRLCKVISCSIFSQIFER